MDNVQIHDIVRVKSLDDPEKNRLFGKYLGVVTKVRYLTRLAFVNFADLKLKQGIPWSQWFPFSDLEIIPSEELNDILIKDKRSALPDKFGI